MCFIRRRNVKVRSKPPCKKPSKRWPFVSRCTIYPASLSTPRAGPYWDAGAVRDQVRRLPCVDRGDLNRLATVLETWAAGLLEQAVAWRGTDGAMASRKEALYRYLDLHAAEPVGLTDLARFINLSPSRTSHLVRELTGSNFQTLRIRERLRKATALLRSTDLSIAEVGHLVGIDDAGYFSRLFRSRLGMTPGKYREQGPYPKPPRDLDDAAFAAHIPTHMAC